MYHIVRPNTPQKLQHSNESSTEQYKIRSYIKLVHD